MAVEPLLPIPWSVQDYVHCLSETGMDCRIMESQAPLYIENTTRAWNDYFQRIDPETMIPANLKLAVAEATVSHQRVAMIKNGLLDFYRFYAIVH
jgi:hypothetical protein